MHLRRDLCRNVVSLIMFFLFWELIGIATKNKEDLVVLLLDFEKAYDRINWDFMKGSFFRLGFSVQWIGL